MTSRLNDFLNTRDENEKRPGDPRKPDGTPTTAADVEGQPPIGNNQAFTKYRRVGWSEEIPVAALTPSGTREAQARSPGGYLEVVAITQIRGNTTYGLQAPNAAGEPVQLVPRTFA